MIHDGEQISPLAATAIELVKYPSSQNIQDQMNILYALSSLPALLNQLQVADLPWPINILVHGEGQNMSRLLISTQERASMIKTSSAES